MKIYQWGILSTANIGQKAMIPALKASKFAKVAAVASRDADKAHQFANKMSIPIAYGDYQALLDDPTIEIIYNPLPNHLHKPWTIKAAEAGKHILCEKPMALNQEECREMIAAARANGVLLMESFMYRHHPRIMAAREMVQSGRLGKVHTIESAFTFKSQHQVDIRYDPAMGGGALMDVGCYCVNISRLMAGREPLTVQARAVWTPSGVDDQLTAILDFGDELLAHFDCGFNQNTRQRCIISGTDAFLVIRKAFVPGKGKSALHKVVGDQSNKIEFAWVDQYQMIAEDFMSAIETGELAYPAEDAVTNMAVIEALLESAKQNGKPVDL